MAQNAAEAQYRVPHRGEIRSPFQKLHDLALPRSTSALACSALPLPLAQKRLASPMPRSDSASVGAEPLESHFRTYLADAPGHGARHLTELAARDVADGVAEVGMVEDVEEFPS
jgi:hypothetical protein